MVVMHDGCTRIAWLMGRVGLAKSGSVATNFRYEDNVHGCSMATSTHAVLCWHVVSITYQ
jgi:hypothetical protein